jgi:hypothetical protein
MRPIKLEHHEMKRITLTQEQLKQAIRNYIRPTAIPPRNTPMEFHCGTFKDFSLTDVDTVTIEWSDASFVSNE